MRSAVYNSAIPEAILKSVARASRNAAHSFFSYFLFITFIIFALANAALADDWNVPEEQLARKIVAVTGPGAAALTVENRSSLTRRDSEVVQDGLRSALESLGLRFVRPEQAAATVTISLSENESSYVWVAEVRQAAGDSAIVMVATPRPQGSAASHESAPLTLRKMLLWAQNDPILDVAVLEEGATPSHIAVLDSEKVSLYRMQGGKWQIEQAFEIAHTRPWPRDLRGWLVPAKDHLLDVYLPGVICASTTAMSLALNCRESDDPWPLAPGPIGTFSGSPAAVFPSGGQSSGGAEAAPQMKAFFAPTRNFFTGALTPGVGKFTTVPKFYSAAPLPREKYALWLFAATDGQAHMVDGVNDRAARLGWGSDVAGVRTLCGAGWQILATSSGNEGEDSIRAYEFPDRDPVAVSTAMDFPGTITALWTESRGDTAVAVVRNQETGSYEAFRLAISCSQ
jgi:hypothetical protein